jgi:multidrug efflux system outer membrane protein
MKARLFVVSLLAFDLATAGGRPKIAPKPQAPDANVPDSYYQSSALKERKPDATTENWWAALNDVELTALIERALKSNLDLRIAASRVLEARSARGITRADLLPSLVSNNNLRRLRGGLTDGIFNLNPNANGATSVFAPVETNDFQFGFDASWEIDFFGGRRHALEAATADVRAFQEARRGVVVSLLAEVARNYSELRGLQRRLEIVNQNIKLQQDTFDLVRVRAEAGLGTQLDVERQATQLASTRALVPTLETATAQAIHRIGVLVGEEPGTLFTELAKVRPLPLEPVAVPVGLPADLLKRRPDIRAAQARIDGETARVGVAHADLFPKVILNGGVGRQGTEITSLTLGAGNFFSFGPAITLPIFSGGKIRANIAAEKERLNQALLEYRNTVLHALEETEDSLVAYNREKERREAVTSAVESSRQATGLANELYTRGLSDFLDVLDAQRQQLVSEDDLVQSDTSVVTDLIALYKALGGGWEVLER